MDPELRTIRKVLAEARDPKSYADYSSANIDYDSFLVGVEAAVDLFTEALASIYREEGQ